MAKVLITDSYLEDIADAIRAKLDVQTTYKPGQMAAAIENIPVGSGVPLISESDWSALSLEQKHTYDLVAVQSGSIGYTRGTLVYGRDAVGEIKQSGTASSSCSVSALVSGTYRLIVLALNSEASTKTLIISASQNNTVLTGTTLDYHQYNGSGPNRRNYRLNAYDVNLAAGDTIDITLTDANIYSSFVYAIIENSPNTVVQAYSTADAVCSGTYSASTVVLQGTFNSSNGGTINLQNYVAGETIMTSDPGTNYKSAYIFWLT